MQRQNPENNNRGITKKDVGITAAAGIGSSAISSGVVIGIGGILAQSAGIGAAMGATGGPIGIAVGAVAGLLIGIIAGIMSRKKARQESEENNRRVEAAIQAGLEPFRRETNSLRTQSIEKDQTIRMLRWQQEILEEKIKYMRQREAYQSSRMDRIEKVLLTMGASPEQLRYSVEEKEEEEKTANIHNHHQMFLMKELSKCVQDTLLEELMQDPVIADDGKLYDRPGLKNWYDECKRQGITPTCPETRIELTDPAHLPRSESAVQAVQFLKNNFSDDPDFQAVLAQDEKSTFRSTLSPGPSASSSSEPFPCAVEDETIPLLSSSSESSPRTLSSLASPHSPGLFAPSNFSSVSSIKVAEDKKLENLQIELSRLTA